ncbi:MAG: response regulator [Acidobacteriaceae bacterium]
MTPEQNDTQGFADTQASFPPPSAPAQGSPQSADPSQAGHQGQNQEGGQARRRRRRRKKNKGGAAQPQQGQQAQQGQPQAQAAPQQQQAGPGNQQKPRKQKSQQKFQRQANPGNSYGNGNGNQQGGGRRKNKQRKQHAFVGPMDHSYRTVNGNVADSPPSTIDVRNGNVNGNVGGYMEQIWDAPLKAREDAPTRIFCFIEDLFFIAKINEVSRKTGIKVAFLKGADKEAIAGLMDAPEENRASLIIFDLNNANAKPLTLIPKIKAKFKRGTSIVGFLSHIQGDLKLKAQEVGCDTVMPRSAFSQNLPNLLLRYGLEEEAFDALDQM